MQDRTSKSLGFGFSERKILIFLEDLGSLEEPELI
jgi:hypothetical protein